MPLSGEMYPEDPNHPATMGEPEALLQTSRDFEVSGEAFGENQTPATVAIDETFKHELSDEAFPVLEGPIESEEPSLESVAEYKIPEDTLQKRLDEAKTAADAELAPEEE